MGVCLPLNPTPLPPPPKKKNLNRGFSVGAPGGALDWGGAQKELSSVTFGVLQLWVLVGVLAPAHGNFPSVHEDSEFKASGLNQGLDW